MFKILAATKNANKLRELRDMLDQFEFEEEVAVVGPDDVGGIPDVEEDGDTFEANAAKKAISASLAAELPAFADDSGLVVEALGGAPGVMSARYAGPGAGDAALVSKLLCELEGREDRAAKFVCVIAVANEGEVVGEFRGEIRGRIALAPRGANGFGYDPVFVPEGGERTFAEMSDEEKNKVSHRSKAIAAAVEFFQDAMTITI